VRLSGFFVFLILLLTACASATVPTPTPQIEANQVPANESASDWRNISLRDVHTGETFTLGSFAGKTILVHPMAMWCINCRMHQRSLRDNVIPQLDQEQFVFISLDIETNAADADLAEYADNENFDWVFAVATPEMMESLVAEFGQSVTVPPTQPHFIIRPDGSTTELLNGTPQPDEYVALLQEANQVGM
jgi:hypothetical protein